MATVNLDFEESVTRVLDSIKHVLISKHAQYGGINDYVPIFSSEQNNIEVSIDDKLSRIANQNIDEDEDVLEDLIGYLVLLKISLQN